MKNEWWMWYQLCYSLCLQKKMQKTDHARRAYYEQFTGKHWGDSRNYNLSLDTGFLGYDTCVQLICNAARKADAFQE